MLRDALQASRVNDRLLKLRVVVALANLQAPGETKEETGSLRSEGDTLLNGAVGQAKNPEGVFDPSTLYKGDWSLQKCDIATVTTKAGWQDIALPPDGK